MTAPYPLTFEPLLYEKVWGGRRLATLGKALPAGGAVGESWEIADLGATSASGAGGGEARSVIAHGALRGRTLSEAAHRWGADLLGQRPAEGGGFPLLVKFLDAAEHLSVQVHPSEAYARAHPGVHVKSEAWYVVAAEPGARIFTGLRDGAGRTDLERAVRDGCVPEVLASVPARPGDCFTIPTGTVHALGRGVLVAEVQTPSDTTFRLYDWGRTGRALHVREAMACLDERPVGAPARMPEGGACARLSATDRFLLDEARVSCAAIGLAGPGWDGAPAGSPAIVMVIRGMGELAPTDGGFEPVPLAPGRTVLVPASLVARSTLRMGPSSVVLRVTLPA